MKIKMIFFIMRKNIDTIWNYGNEIIKIAKPQSLRKTIRLFVKVF